MKQLPVKSGTIFLSDNLKSDLSDIIKNYDNSKIFVLADENTFKYCYPYISDINGINPQKTYIVKAGDNQKNINSLILLWQFFVNQKVDRHSLLINLGGGMVCDLGGFAAATFKRGIPFINIPTTILAQVDASTGGKTGINFMEYKNEIGLFKHAESVIFNTELLKHLDKENILSGFAEIIKHTLLKNKESFDKVLTFDINNINFNILKDLIIESVMIKDFFISSDPYDKNIRKALNLGHTIGHAFETFAAMRGKQILHGYAVAYGLVTELYISHLKFGFNIDIINRLSDYVKKNYGKFNFSESDFETLIEIMLHDKKNRNEQINFSLLKNIGEVEIDSYCDKELIYNVLLEII